MSDLDDIAKAVEHRQGGRPTPQQPPRQFGTDRIWTVHDHGRQFGPHTEVEIAVLVGSGEVSHDAMVWRDGSPRWIPVSNIVPLPKRQQVASGAPVIVNIHNVNTVSAVPMVAARPSNGFGTASLVFGVLATVFVCLPFVSIPFAILSLALGGLGVALGHSSGKPTATSTAGIVLSLIVLLLSALVLAGLLSANALHPQPQPTLQAPDSQ